MCSSNAGYNIGKGLKGNLKRNGSNLKILTLEQHDEYVSIWNNDKVLDIYSTSKAYD